MGRLAERRARAALDMLAEVGTATRSAESFARAGVRALPGLVGADLTTLSICALGSGRRRVTGFPVNALAPSDRGTARRWTTRQAVHNHEMFRAAP